MRDRQKNRLTDGQRKVRDFIGCCPTNVEHPTTAVIRSNMYDAILFKVPFVAIK